MEYSLHPKTSVLSLSNDSLQPVDFLDLIRRLDFFGNFCNITNVAPISSVTLAILQKDEDDKRRTLITPTGGSNTRPHAL